jgi:GNAT superfamily N-acetyltransferase
MRNGESDDVGYRVRLYDLDNDTDYTNLRRMVALVQDAWSPERRPSAYFHLGDLCWQLRDPVSGPQFFLWENYRSGQLAGFAAWDDASATIEMQPHPDYMDDERRHCVLRNMIGWAMEQAGGRSVTAYAAETDAPALSRLAEWGFQRKPETWTNCHLRRLDTNEAIEIPHLPDGYVVRDLRGPEEREARVLGHRAGWQSTILHVEHYERLMRMPWYQPELDIVVVAPDGESFAATTNCWLDEQSGAGLFEPVSTAPAHRRKGLARALMLYGMAQLRARGAKTAWVGSVSKNPAATALYESCGMPVVRRDFPYIRPAERQPE